MSRSSVRDGGDDFDRVGGRGSLPGGEWGRVRRSRVRRRMRRGRQLSKETAVVAGGCSGGSRRCFSM